jgi:hypothetical protein
MFPVSTADDVDTLAVRLGPGITFTYRGVAVERDAQDHAGTAHTPSPMFTPQGRSGLVLLVYPAAVALCFACAPHSKFMHSTYRYIPLLRDSVETAAMWR